MSAEVDVSKLVEIAEKAGEVIMQFYSGDIDIQVKEDNSPVTAADFAASQFIIDALNEYYPDIPALSEESSEEIFEKRRKWNRFFIIDPLDGTKEFIKRSDEFTVNIALIENGRPIIGVIYLPVQKVTYFGSEKESYKIEEGHQSKLPLQEYVEGKLRVMISKSHVNSETQKYIDELKEKFEVSYDNVGSSIKICLVAEGCADLNPRLGVGTKEWDIAAGHAIMKGAGGDIHIMGTSKSVPYNKESLLNPEYEVKRKELLTLSLK